jgi:hypothetical protein
MIHTNREKDTNSRLKWNPWVNVIKPLAPELNSKCDLKETKFK